jgi:hypothetical protein
MAWRTEIRQPVIRALGALRASGLLSRRGLILAYTSMYTELPKHARRFQTTRYAQDPNCFLYPVSFLDKGAWQRFAFYVNDTETPGVLVVEDVDRRPK